MKISKSLGNAFDPVEKATEFGLDALRYFLLRESSFSDDGDYSDVNMTSRLNGELADNLGNLMLRCVSRTINKDAAVPEPGEYTEVCGDFVAVPIMQTTATNQQVARTEATWHRTPMANSWRCPHPPGCQASGVPEVWDTHGYFQLPPFSRPDAGDLVL